MLNVMLIQELILCQKEYNIPYSDSVQPVTHILAKFQFMFMLKKVEKMFFSLSNFLLAHQ